ncbi:MAG: DUF3347 domain-containing protein [Ferruginibacter sp.]
MKKIFFIVAFFTTITVQYSFAQDNTKTTSLTQLLNSYYDIKNALVSSDAKTAATKAGELVKALNAVDMKALSEADMNAFMPLQDKLAFDAKHISENNGIAEQREHFFSLSNNIYKLAKAVKLSAEPVYQAYCPMKKMYWLSSEAAIKNPYYGKAMPTCGKVTDTLK